MIHWNYILSLEQDIIRLSNFIEFNKDNFKTYSIEILKLNLAIGSEIDVVFKQLCKSYYPNGKFNSIKSYKIFLNENLKEILSEKIMIPRYNIELIPLKEIESLENGMYNNPFWWDNYNSIKHHRDSDFSKANLKNLIYSFGALVLINIHRIIKTKSITDLSCTFQEIESLSLFDVDSKYKLKILGLY